MGNSKFTIGSTLIGSVIVFVATEAANLLRTHKERKLLAAKRKITDDLNQRIGYLKCQEDELIKLKESIKPKSIFRKNSSKTQLDEIGERIREKQSQIKECEQQISEIRSCNTIRMLRYAEEKINLPALEDAVGSCSVA